jgi:hypothetical protein
MTLESEHLEVLEQEQLLNCLEQKRWDALMVEDLIRRHPKVWIHWIEVQGAISWETVLEFVHLCPSICRLPLKHRGWTLLHYLCSNGGAPEHVVASVAAVCSLEITQPDSYIGDTCLHLVGRSSSHFSASKLQCLLKLCDDARTAVLIRNRMGGTVLHAAANGAAVFEAIQAIVDTNPNVLLITSHEGIHAVSALWYSYSETIPGHMTIVRILNGDIEHAKCNKAFLQFWCKIEYLAIQYFAMSNTCPEGLDNHQLQKYILHGLLQCNVPINIVKSCLQYQPETALAADIDGNLPLHVLVGARPYRLREKDAVEACLLAAPQAAGVPNYANDVPLTLAIRSKIPVTTHIFDLLLEYAPWTIRHEDRETGLFPFQVAAMQGTNAQSVNTIFLLLLRQPELLRPHQ